MTRSQVFDVLIMAFLTAFGVVAAHLYYKRLKRPRLQKKLVWIIIFYICLAASSCFLGVAALAARPKLFIVATIVFAIVVAVSATVPCSNPFFRKGWPLVARNMLLLAGSGYLLYHVYLNFF